MAGYAGRHALASAPGALALATWSIYILSAVVLYYPNFLASILIAGFFGLVACAAVVLNSRYWRATVELASSVYVVLYVVRVLRMITMTAPDQSFLSSLGVYYGMLWPVTAGVFQEKGMIGGSAQVFFEYAMPPLVILVAVMVLASRRQQPALSRVG